MEEERKKSNKATSQQSHKLVLNKFLRDLRQYLMQVSQDEEQQPETLNYLRLKELLVLMGLITEQSATADSQERVLLYDFWRTLGGEERQEITVKDATTLIVAILRMSDPRSVGVEVSNQDLAAFGYINNQDHFVIGSK